MGAEIEIEWKRAEKDYIEDQYPQVGEVHYSLPSHALLKEDEISDLLKLPKKMGVHEVDPPSDRDAICLLFHRIKSICEGPQNIPASGDQKFPSLVILGEKFCRTLQDVVHHHPERGSNNTESQHVIYLTYPGGENIYSFFFQVKSSILREDQETVKKEIIEAIHECKRQKQVFYSICGTFLEPAVIFVAIPSFPFIRREDLQKSFGCNSCLSRILTSEDIQDPDHLRKFLHPKVEKREWKWIWNILLGRNSTPKEFHAKVNDLPVRGPFRPNVRELFKKIFSRQVSVYSAVDVPRTHNRGFIPHASHEEWGKALCILTPDQWSLVEDRSNCLFLTGGSGTGKTLVLKERAKRLSLEGCEVLVVNIARGLLTTDFKIHFKGKLGITLRKKTWVFY